MSDRLRLRGRAVGGPRRVAAGPPARPRARVGLQWLVHGRVADAERPVPARLPPGVDRVRARGPAAALAGGPPDRPEPAAGPAGPGAAPLVGAAGGPGGRRPGP